MRRLILESSVDEVRKLLGLTSSVMKLESLEILSFLRNDPEEITTICKAKFKDKKTELGEIIIDPQAKIQLLEKDEYGYQIFFMKRTRLFSQGRTVLAGGGYLSAYEIRDGKIRATFLGNSKEIVGILSRVKRIGANYRVVSIGDARFLQSSPLSKLTDKQRKVLIAAYDLGYYEFPKKISSDDLARKLNIRSSTLVKHRIKAERRILTELLNQT